MKVVAVDPGKVSGVAVADLPSLRAPAGAELPGLYSTVSWVENEQPEAVVCESFIPRPGAKSWQPDALETIGALRYLALLHGWEFELQSPADAKKFSTNEKLKKLHWYVPGGEGHANDARRHLLLYAVRHQLISVTEALVD